jgi:hypothetical protein
VYRLPIPKRRFIYLYLDDKKKKEAEEIKKMKNQKQNKSVARPPRKK